MKKELKPCPFCGGESEINSFRGHGTGEMAYEPRCKVLGCIGRNTTGKTFSSEAEATEAWNTRYVDTSIPTDTSLCEEAGKINKALGSFEDHVQPTSLLKWQELRNSTIMLIAHLVEEVGKHQKFPSYDFMLKERQHCFQILNEKQPPITGGSHLDDRVDELIKKCEDLDKQLKINKDAGEQLGRMLKEEQAELKSSRDTSQCWFEKHNAVLKQLADAETANKSSRNLLGLSQGNYEQLQAEDKTLRTQLAEKDKTLEKIQGFLRSKKTVASISADNENCCVNISIGEIRQILDNGKPASSCICRSQFERTGKHIKDCPLSKQVFSKE